MSFELRLGNCIQHLHELRSTDAVVMDPPFGISYSSGYGSLSWEDGSIPSDDNTNSRDIVIDAAMQLNLPILCFGSWKAPRPAETRMRLVWDTGGALGMGDLKLPWKPSDAEIYVLGSRHRFKGKRTSNVLRFPPVQSMAKNGRLHPMEKPVALMMALISKVDARRIVDPFMGSGSTGVACGQLGIDFLGCELNPKYYEIAEKRIAAAYSQLVMF